MFNNINNPAGSILKHFGVSPQQQLQKGGKPAAEGEVRDWHGKKYQKVGGEWKEVIDKKNGGKSDDPSKQGGQEQPQQPGGGTGGPPTIDKHQVAQMTHMKSVIDSDPKKAYQIFQSLTPEAQHAVPQEVINKLVEAHHTPEKADEHGGVDYDKLGKKEQGKGKEYGVSNKPSKDGTVTRPDGSGGWYKADAKTGKRIEEKKEVSDAKKSLGVENKKSKSGDNTSISSDREGDERWQKELEKRTENFVKRMEQEKKYVESPMTDQDTKNLRDIYEKIGKDRSYLAARELPSREKLSDLDLKKLVHQGYLKGEGSRGGSQPSIYGRTNKGKALLKESKG
jgi:hypothetical protein